MKKKLPKSHKHKTLELSHTVFSFFYINSLANYFAAFLFPNRLLSKMVKLTNTNVFVIFARRERIIRAIRQNYIRSNWCFKSFIFLVVIKIA